MKQWTFIFLLVLLPVLAFSQAKIAIFPLEDESAQKYPQLSPQMVTSNVINLFKNTNRFTVIEREKLPEVLSANLKMNSQLDANLLNQIDADYACFGRYLFTADVFKTYLPDINKYSFKVTAKLTIFMRIVATKAAIVVASEQADSKADFKATSRSSEIKLNNAVFDTLCNDAIPKVVYNLTGKIPATVPQPVIVQPPVIPQPPVTQNGKSGTPQAGKSDTVVVNGTGYGDRYEIAKEMALQDAFRTAIEQVAGVYLKSESETKDFQLVKDQIIAESKGVISTYNILSEEKSPSDPKELHLKVECTVSWASVRDRWQSIRGGLLKIKNYPTILVQTNLDSGGLEAGTRDLTRDTLQTQLEAIFTEAGFQVVSFDVIKRNIERDYKLAEQAGDTSVMRDIARKYKARYLLVFDFATKLDTQNVFGTGIAAYRSITTVTGRVIRSDNARQLASLPKTYTGNAQSNATYAISEGLKDAGKQFGKDMIHEMLRLSWDFEAQEGGAITVKISKIQYSLLRKVKKALEGTTGVKQVSQDSYNDEVVTLQVMSSLNSEKLLDVIFDEAEKNNINLKLKNQSENELILEVGN